MTETLFRDHPRRTPPDGATISSCEWLLLLEGTGSGPLIAESHGSKLRQETSGPRCGGADPTRGASDPRGGSAGPEGILRLPHAAGEAVRPVPRGGFAAPGERRTRAGDQPAPPRPARPRFPAQSAARASGPGAPERSGAGARGSRRPARAMIPERLCVSGGEPAPRRSRERRRVLRERDANADRLLTRGAAPAVRMSDPPADGRARLAIGAAGVRVAGTAVASSAGPRDGFRRRTSAGRTGADKLAPMAGDAT